MAFDIHSMLLLVFSTSMDLDLFYYLHCEVQSRYVYFFVFHSSCWDVSWISTNKTRRKRWTPPGFQWYRGQHQTVYRARKGVKEWFVEIKLFAHYTLYVILVLTFCVLFFLQDQVALSFHWLQTSFVLCPALSGFCISITWTINRQSSRGVCELLCSFSMKYWV